MTDRARSTSSSAEDLRNYFRFASLLQMAIGKNRLDTSFAKKGGKVTYLIDSNLTISYLMGEEEKLKGILSLHGLMGEDAARLNQELTVRYILSGGLVGQVGPLVMTTPHWNEAMVHLDVAALGVRKNIADASKRAVKDLGKSLPSLAELSDDPVELLRKAQDLGISELLGSVRKALRVQDRLAHVFHRHEPRVRCLERLNIWNKVVDRTRNDDYKQWRSLLDEYRRHDDYAGPQSKNIDADAKSLACIEALYRETPSANGRNASERFLFVTSDSSIVLAAEKRANMLKREGIPNFVREALVYNPLINFSVMHLRASQLNGESRGDSNPDDLRRVFLQVEEAVGALFPSDELPRVRKERWARHWRLVENIERWSDAAEKIALVNSKLLSEEIRAPEAKLVASILSEDDIAAAAECIITSSLAEIKDDHERNMSAIALENLAKLLERPTTVGEETRAPIKIHGVDLLTGVRARLGSRFPQIKTPAELLDLMARPGEQTKPLVDAISQTLREAWDDAHSQLLAASIYLGVHAWESALACALRSQELASRVPGARTVRREAGYCAALSLRMMMRSEEDVLRAKSILEDNMASTFSKEPLIALRDAVERCTLLISASVVQAIHNHGQYWDESVGSCYLISGNLVWVFDGATRDLEDALESVLEDFVGVGKEERLVSEILLQGAANLLGAHLLRHYLNGRVSAENSDLMRVLASTKETLKLAGFGGRLPHPVARGYMAAAQFEAGELRQSEALSEIDGILSGTVLTEADRIEFRYMRWMVERHLALPTPGQKAVS